MNSIGEVKQNSNSRNLAIYLLHRINGIKQDNKLTTEKVSEGGIPTIAEDKISEGEKPSITEDKEVDVPTVEIDNTC